MAHSRKIIERATTVVPSHCGCGQGVRKCGVGDGEGVWCVVWCVDVVCGREINKCLKVHSLSLELQIFEVNEMNIPAIQVSLTSKY